MWKLRGRGGGRANLPLDRSQKSEGKEHLQCYQQQHHQQQQNNDNRKTNDGAHYNHPSNESCKWSKAFLLKVSLATFPLFTMYNIHHLSSEIDHILFAFRDIILQAFSIRIPLWAVLDATTWGGVRHYPSLRTQYTSLYCFTLQGCHPHLHLHFIQLRRRRRKRRHRGGRKT